MTTTDDRPAAVDSGERDPFASMAEMLPLRYAPGHTRRPFEFTNLDEWHPVIYGGSDAGGAQLVEPYPAGRADATDGQGLLEDHGDPATVAVVRWNVPFPSATAEGGYLVARTPSPRPGARKGWAYEARVRTQRDLMAAWCEAYAVAAALNNRTVTGLGLQPGDVEVLLAAQRGALTGDSRYAGSIDELRWQRIGTSGVERVPAAVVRRLRDGRHPLLAAATTRPRHPEQPGDSQPWIETTYRVTLSGAFALDLIRRQYQGPDRCRICGCIDEVACPDGCAWVHDPELGLLCSACIPDDVDAAAQ